MASPLRANSSIKIGTRRRQVPVGGTRQEASPLLTNSCINIGTRRRQVPVGGVGQGFGSKVTTTRRNMSPINFII